MASTAMQRPVLNFANGTPYEIALKYGTGKQTSNGRVMFSTVDGEVFFCDEFDADAIYALELKPQEPFKILKRGGQIMVERVKRVERPVDETPTAPAAPPRSAERLEQTPQPQHNNPSRTMANMMASSYISAMDALMIAQDYASTKGLPFKISTMELRSAALSIFIAISRQGVR